MELRHQNQFEMRIHEVERLIDAKMTTLRTIIDLQAEKSVTLLASSDKAISKAEVATEKR
ncbi:MAG: hypothetical protein QOH97_5459, partial [Actinoplanes sp.]|nr:hypothetical protein [Actinoplanes sp.]